MSLMELREAQLFRMLTAIFGEDAVVFNMSALSVSGGEVPECFPDAEELRSRDVLTDWARETKCLFTVVDRSQEPKLVVDFLAMDGSVVDVYRAEAQGALPRFLEACGVRYVLLSNKDFADIMDPASSLTLPKFIALYLELPE